MNEVTVYIITIGMCACGLLIIILIDNHIKNKVRARVEKLLSENWFISELEMEKAKEAIKSVFKNTEFEFKIDWDDVQTNIITSYDVKCIISRLKGYE